MDTHDNLTRLTLLIKLRESDNEGAWVEFERIYSPFIYNLVRRMDFQHHDAMDLSQAILLKVWQKIDQYSATEKSGSFRGWLATMTRNTVRDYIRTKKNFITNRNSVDYEDFFRDLEEHTLPKIEQLAKEEWVIYVTNMAKKNVIENLSEQKQTIFELCLKEVPIKEIAKKLGVTETNVYIHRQDIFKKMKMEIKHLNNEL